MQIESTRFGTVEVRDDAILTFPDHLPGLPDRTWALIGGGDDSPFYWLHSAETPSLAVPVTNPWQFFGDYEVRVPDEDAGRLGLGKPDDALILCVVKASERLADFTINLAGPLIRYEIGDFAEAGTCECGRSLPTLKRIAPRREMLG